MNVQSFERNRQSRRGRSASFGSSAGGGMRPMRWRRHESRHTMRGGGRENRTGRRKGMSEHTEYDEKLKDDGERSGSRMTAGDEQALVALADLFKVFGDPTRTRILGCLQTGSLCVGEIAEALGMSLLPRRRPCDAHHGMRTVPCQGGSLTASRNAGSSAIKESVFAVTHRGSLRNKGERRRDSLRIAPYRRGAGAAFFVEQRLNDCSIDQSFKRERAQRAPA